MFAKFVASCALLILSVGLSILVLVNGYGLEIHSWAWIIFGCLAQMVILSVNTVVLKE